MNFEAVIGLEIHVETKSKTKMFSSAPNEFSKTPNTNVTYLDFAFPGTLPVVNKQAVINAIRVCSALHMSIDREIWFDRKNYFYSDLPKGYQITQQFRPIGKDGYVDIRVNNKIKRIGIERAHMEEDTCKQLHMRDYSLLDYNRAGVPLLEIVSLPEIKNGTEAMEYVNAIRNIVIYSDVSDGKMEEGSLRCDVNISLMPCGAKKFGTKVEIKNLNSTANIEKAVDFEILRQSKLLLKGLSVVQETRRWDETKKETVLMRLKTDAVDYKYFVEPNIVPIKLDEKFISEVISTCPELLEAKRKRYIEQFGLSEYDADVILFSKDNALYFEEICKFTKEYKLAANWLIGDIQSYLNKSAISIKEFEITPSSIALLINNIATNKISSKQAKEIFLKTLEKEVVLEEAIALCGSSFISNDDEILKLVNTTLDEFPQSIIDYFAGKDRSIGFLVGQIMKKSHGKVNPKLTNEILLREINKRK
ncbi:MAG: Asp-tRNA(Asn)/Glu-tRNA(Gln) amidotransferase subunit GatB [Bacilli bacterium]